MPRNYPSLQQGPMIPNQPLGTARATKPNIYYNSIKKNYGEYAFVSLGEIINNFTAHYVGEGKLLPNTLLKGDIIFHANRALQELSYDTLRSCKSLEIEVCPSLRVPLPHDYVNYTKLTSVDSNGIEHIIYPTRHTSNPFAIEQNDDCVDCKDTAATYADGKDGFLKEQQIECDAGDVTCTFANPVSDNELDYSIFGENLLGANQVYQAFLPGGVAHYFSNSQRSDYWEAWTASVDNYCLCLQSSGSEDNCGEQNSQGWTAFIEYSVAGNGGLNMTANMGNRAGWSGLTSSINTSIGRGQAVNGDWQEFTNNVTSSFASSNTWDNYRGSGSNQVAIDQSTTTNLSVDADNYFQNTGERFGIQPEHAQANGSYFIDCHRGMIHFSSNLSGKTVIIHYLSDHRGRKYEQIIPKFAEEAMYKWIAYGCLSSRIDIPEYVIQRFKKERFAETRKAKIRISNIKIEEISQIMRNRSKWIKH